MRKRYKCAPKTALKSKKYASPLVYFVEKNHCSKAYETHLRTPIRLSLTWGAACGEEGLPTAIFYASACARVALRYETCALCFVSEFSSAPFSNVGSKERRILPIVVNWICVSILLTSVEAQHLASSFYKTSLSRWHSALVPEVAVFRSRRLGSPPGAGRQYAKAQRDH